MSTIAANAVNASHFAKAATATVVAMTCDQTVIGCSIECRPIVLTATMSSAMVTDSVTSSTRSAARPMAMAQSTRQPR